LPHSDWLASSNRSKPITALYLEIFAVVKLKLPVAKIRKYGILIGLQWLDKASQSK
jgi:hypothetical protein